MVEGHRKYEISHHSFSDDRSRFIDQASFTDSKNNIALILVHAVTFYQPILDDINQYIPKHSLIPT